MTSSRRASKRVSSDVSAEATDIGDVHSPVDGFQHQPGPNVHDQHLQVPETSVDSSSSNQHSSEMNNDPDKKSKEGRYSFTLGNDGSNSRMAPSMFAGAGTGLGVSMNDGDYLGQVPLPMVSDPHIPTLSTIGSSNIEPNLQQPAVTTTANAISKAAEAAAESQQTSEPRQPHRAYLGPTGPSQPYGMYPQNTIPVDDDQIQMHVTDHSIPMGFAGREQTFHRRLGPEGEEAQDSITADGYREPLPAYSERDDIATLKRAPPAAVAGNAAGPSSTQQQQPPVEPSANDDMYASGITVRTESNAAEVAPENRLSPNPGSPSEASMTSERNITDTQSVLSDSSQRPFNPNTTTMSSELEKPEPKKKGIFSKRLWILVGAAILLIIFIGSLAGALSRRGHRRPPQQPAASDSAPTSTYVEYVPTPTDISSLTATPTGINPPPTGSWALPIEQARVMQRTCLSSSSELNAWSCTFAGDPFFELNITQPQDNSSKAYLMLGSARPSTGYPRYGAQPASVTQTQPLQLVSDLNDQGRGPAYFFSTVYNKTVILKKQDFNPPQHPPDPLRRRQLAISPTVSHPVPLPAQGGGNPNSLFNHVSHKEAKAGEQLWVCTWEDTLLEGFIYPTQNSSMQGYGAVDPNLPPPTTTMDSADATSTGGTDSTDTATAAAPTFTMVHPPPPFGNIFKLLESRAPTVKGSKPPYCKLVSVAGGGRLSDVLDPESGKLIQYILQEPVVSPQEPVNNAASSTKRKGVVGNAIINKRSGDSSCRCEWMNF